MLAAASPRWRWLPSSPLAGTCFSGGLFARAFFGNGLFGSHSRYCFLLGTIGGEAGAMAANAGHNHEDNGCQ